MDWESSVTDRDLEQEQEAVNQAKAAGANADQVLVKLGVGPAPAQPEAAKSGSQVGQPTMAVLPAAECTKRLSQAELIIAQANLYRLALEGGFFEPGSGIPSIVELVTNEFKTFATQRLEVLLGMKTPEQAALSDEARDLLQSIKNLGPDGLTALKFLVDLGPEGRDALAMIVTKVLGKPALVATQAPVEAPKASKPSIRRVKAPSGATPQDTPQVAPQGEPKPRKKYQKTDNPNRLPMPTPEQEAAKYSAESEHFGRAKGLIVTVATEAAAKKTE